MRRETQKKMSTNPQDTTNPSGSGATIAPPAQPKPGMNPQVGGGSSGGSSASGGGVGTNPQDCRCKFSMSLAMDFQNLMYDGLMRGEQEGDCGSVMWKHGRGVLMKHEANVSTATNPSTAKSTTSVPANVKGGTNPQDPTNP